jgi:hypothetical protein
MSLTKQKTVEGGNLPSAVPGRSGWTRVAFGEVAEQVTDRVSDPSEAGVDRYVGLEHLDPGSLVIRRWGSPSDVEATKLRFGPGDVLFGKRRAYQRKLAQADFEGICSAHAMVLRSKSDLLLRDFLPVLMQGEAFHQRALAISVGSLSPTINWRTLAKEEFDLPPLDEQRRIVKVAQGIDNLVEATRRAVAACETAQAVCMAPILAEGPRGVGRVALSDVVSVHRKRIEPLASPATEYEHYSLPSFDDRGAPIREPGSDILSHKFTIEGSVVLFSTLNPRIPRIWRVNNAGPNSICSTEFAAFSPSDKDILSLDFLQALLSSQPFIRRMQAVAKGSTKSRERVAVSDIVSVEVSLPPMSEQLTLVERLTKLSVLVHGRRDALVALGDLRQSLIASMAGATT